MGKKVKLEKNEAIVLFEFLSRFFDKGKLYLTDEAEEIVLNKILGQLEKTLVEPFDKNYKTEILKQAMEIVRGQRYQCPCCSNITLPQEPPGTYEICHVCYWEDDGVQYDDPNYRGGANRASLNEAKDNYKKFGASEREFIDSVRRPYENELPNKN